MRNAQLSKDIGMRKEFDKPIEFYVIEKLFWFFLIYISKDPIGFLGSNIVVSSKIKRKNY